MNTPALHEGFAAFAPLDSRVQTALDYVERHFSDDNGYEAALLADVLAYALDQRRMLIGAIATSTALQAKARAPETVDLSMLPLTALTDEILRRAGSTR